MVNKGHGRIEMRRCWSVADPDCIGYINDRQKYFGLISVAMVESERLVDSETSNQVRYYISGLPGSAESLLRGDPWTLGYRELSIALPV